MKKLFKILGVVVLIILLAAGGVVGYVSFNGVPAYEAHLDNQFEVVVTPEKLVEGERIVNMMCKNCHLNESSGRLTGSFLREAPPEFGKLFSKNITNHPDAGIGSWTDGQLAYFLRTGISPRGDFAPIMPRLHMYSDEDLASVIAFLRSDHPMVQADSYKPPKSDFSLLAKFLANYVIKPMPYPEGPVTAPDTADKVAYGRYLAVAKWDCYGCHSADFKTMNPLEPEKTPGFFGGGNLLLDNEGKEIFSANLTFDETGLKGWSEEEFGKALKYGLSKHGALRYPMVPFVQVKDEEISAIYAYLKSVPKIKNDVDRKRIL